MDYSVDEGEFKKALFLRTLECPPTLLIDNVFGELNSSLLCSAVTQETIKNRILGVSKTAEIPTSTLITVTGNNLVVAGDMVRRSLFCNMDAGMERPGERVCLPARFIHGRMRTDRALYMPPYNLACLPYGRKARGRQPEAHERLFLMVIFGYAAHSSGWVRQTLDSRP